ncbi:hypothetical protein BST81_12255 [Leptolyngbya sp. 'hensonii']|uniref:SHOCT domain-containing protein n=1 Tax=Leptolyngbya sp. 'hensonii' TaxID=1922337 RepID=UPI00095028CC|nr:SHOCT domain-containing protein [Leptolyngbya sp. 'hensonii']OLP17832.1 hypothetical protein BST81_12255 [Leptolyngbya sp. 'hensonii']
MLSRPKNRQVAALLALLGILVPISGFHKFYLGQPLWGLFYLLLSLGTPIARIASAIEAVWYLIQRQEDFDRNFNATIAKIGSTGRPGQAPTSSPVQVGAISEAVRQLDQLRQDGLITEYEFEQKRRQLLDRIG